MEGYRNVRYLVSVLMLASVGAKAQVVPMPEDWSAVGFARPVDQPLEVLKLSPPVFVDGFFVRKREMVGGSTRKILIRSRYFDVFIPDDVSASDQRMYVDILDRTAERFVRHFHKGHRRGTMVLSHDHPEHDLYSYMRPGSNWAFGYAILPYDQFPSIIAHEITHKLVYDDWYRPGEIPLRCTRAPYGGPPVPDWLDESIAMLSELNALSRFQEMRTLVLGGADGPFKWPPNSQLPLEKLLTMDHPLADNTDKLDESIPLPIDIAEAVVKFYSGSISLSTFMLKYRGSDVLPEMLRSLSHGKSLADFLRINNGRDGIPKKVPELESAWLDWVRNTEPSSIEDFRKKALGI